MLSMSDGVFRASRTRGDIVMSLLCEPTRLLMAVGTHFGSAKPAVVCRIVIASKLSALRWCSSDPLNNINARADESELLLAACPLQARIALSSSLISDSTVDDIFTAKSSNTSCAGAVCGRGDPSAAKPSCSRFAGLPCGGGCCLADPSSGQPLSGS